MDIPTLETERLRLRGHRLEDFQDCAAMWADPAVTRYIGGNPLTAEEAWSKLLRYAGHWTLLGYGFWAVEEKSSRRFIGEVGIAEFRRQMEPPIRDPEAGWVLCSRERGKGYATEAVAAAISWAETRFGSPRMACLIHPENLTSIRVAEKCGFREQRRAFYRGQPAIVFSR